MEKILNTRIMLKYDTYANWVANNPVLKKGEAAIGTIDTNADGVQNAPSIVVKIGDGVSAYQDLKFISGLAADVYSWAKAATKPEYTADEIEGLSEYISGEIEDTDTQYQIVKVDDYNYKLQSKTLSGSWVDVADSNIVIPAYDDTEVKADIAAAQADVDALEAKVGTVADGKTVVEMISDAQTAATYDDTEVKADIDNLETRVTAVEGEVDTLIGDDTGKSVRTIANEELAAQLIPEDAAESLNTLQEIAAWIQSHPDDASAMNSAIAALQAKVDTGDQTVSAYVTAAIAALNIGDYALASDLTALAGRMTTAEGEIDTLQGDLSDEIARATAAEQANATAISDLEDSLATIATTGNVNDLIQTEGDVLVFDCGTSSTVI